MAHHYQPYQGVIVPIVTPFQPDGSLDLDGLAKLVRHITGQGVGALLLSGTTGEAVSLTEETRTGLLSHARNIAGDGITLYVGIGGNQFQQVVDRGNHLIEQGADAVVIHSPSYYPLGQENLRAWFEKTADALKGPVLIYNIPQTTHHSVDLDTLETLSHHPNIYGVKDSEFDPTRLEEVIRHFHGRERFQVYIGPTVFASQAIRLGANGFIPSLGNVLPGVMQDIFEKAVAGDFQGAEATQQKATGLNDIYLKGQPVGNAICDLKAILEVMGICRACVSLPLLETPPERKEFLRKQALEFGLI